jgi:hypothetical protein
VETITILQDPVDPTVSYDEIRRWAGLAELRKIQDAHEQSEVYTWAIFITRPVVRGGVPVAIYYDYLSHESTILPVAFSDELGVLYDVTCVPLQYA